MPDNKVGAPSNGINFALFGLGNFGKNYQRLLPKIKGVNLEATVTAHSDNAEEVLKNPAIDAVVIATPPSTHFELAKKALEAGKHVLLEKPMVLSIIDAEKLRKIVKKSGEVFMVGFQYLYNDYINYLKKEIESGAFGKILEVKSEHLVSPVRNKPPSGGCRHSGGGRISNGVSPPREDVDIFWDAAPHPLAIYQYFFLPEKLISAKGKIKHDTAHVKVRFENAPILEIIASVSGDPRTNAKHDAGQAPSTRAKHGAGQAQKTRKLTIVGEKATAVLDETLEKDKLTIIKNGLVPPSAGQTVNPQIEFREPLRSEIEHFIQCIKTGETPLTDIDFGCQITEWLEKISQLANQ